MTSTEYRWPDGKRIAVAVTVMLETWSEGKAPPYGVQASPMQPGTVDLGGIAWGSYGGKIGVWRLINLLAANGIRGTFCVNGHCAELYPDAVGQIVKSGHDVAGHAYLQDQLLAYMSPDEERDTISRCLDILEGVTGTRPQGWLSPVMAYTENTRKFLAAERLLWHGDARDTDLPRVAETDYGPIVQIPGSDFTDNRVLRSSSRDLWDVHTETFDYLYRNEMPAFLPLSMHSHFGGRPMIAAVFDKIFKHIAKHSDVWLATHVEIARWVLDNRFDADPRRLLKGPADTAAK
jgi:peptidoglycan/xylan/chitin deacetylase (PgdA/CDA1 family)